MKSQRELSIIGACGGYSKTSAKHAPVVGNSVLNLLINILGSGSGRRRSSGWCRSCGHRRCYRRR
jgi:hypothetical protein